jgi:hypothetical protein
VKTPLQISLIFKNDCLEFKGVFLKPLLLPLIFFSSLVVQAQSPQNLQTEFAALRGNADFKQAIDQMPPNQLAQEIFVMEEDSEHIVYRIGFGPGSTGYGRYTVEARLDFGDKSGLSIAYAKTAYGFPQFIREIAVTPEIQASLSMAENTCEDALRHQ